MSLFLQKLFHGKEPVAQLPAPIPASLPQTSDQPKAHNPFMIAMNRDSQEFHNTYGVNRPLKQPMFLGYRNEKALYGGTRLFILY